MRETRFLFKQVQRANTRASLHYRYQYPCVSRVKKSSDNAQAVTISGTS